MSYHLVDIVQQLGRPKLLVLGDLILDRYIWGDAERISQEAPVILLRQDRQEVRLGGAANVANLLRGLETDVTMAGLVGADADGLQLREALEATGTNCECVFSDPARPTTAKDRFIGRAQHRHPHQMLRVDHESRMPVGGRLAKEMRSRITDLVGEHQAVLISDYSKGVCTPEIVRSTIQAARQHQIPVIVDPGATADYGNYKRATAITPNRLETKLATGMEIDSIDAAFAAGRRLCQELSLDCAFVTLDSDGIAVVLSNGKAELQPTRKREVYDITGAGDMVLAMIGVTAANGVPPMDLARLANVAGGLEVEQIGVVTISRAEILADLLAGGRETHEKVRPLKDLAHHVQARRSLGQRIIMTNGCFDVLHPGHVTYLQQAAAEGDCLIVAINSDDSVRGLNKAPDRPIFSQEHRATMLAALEAVDYVTIFNEQTPHAVIDQLKPDVLVKGGTYGHDEIVGWELVESYGGRVKPLGVVPGVSTTAILNRLRGETTERAGEPQILPLRRKAG